MRTASVLDDPVTRPNTASVNIQHMSQETEGKEDLEAHRERIRKIIDADRDILDELA